MALLVDCLKIINWLQDRKKLRKDWYNYLKAGEEKIKLLLRDREWTISYPEIHSYINRNEHHFNVQDVEKVVQILLQTDLAQSKTMLFGYADKRVKEWTTLQKYMQGNHLTLLNLGKFIEQALRFDLPGINKAVQAFDTQLSTLRRKIDFNQNTIYQQSKGLEKERRLLGVQEGTEDNLNIERLIEKIVSRGPSQILQLQGLISQNSIQKYVDYYSQTNQQNGTDNKLAALEYFMTRGDQFSEVYEEQNKKEKYQGIQKYRQFNGWKGSNQWEIQIQGQSHHNDEKHNETTILQKRQFRQRLLYDLNQLLFFFKGVKHQIVTVDKGLGFESEQNSKDSFMVEGQIDNAIQQLQGIVTFLTSKRLTAPLELKNSKKAYQVLVSQFRGYEANIAAMKEQIESYQIQVEELQQKRQVEVEKLTYLRKKVAECRHRVENLLGELVKREVKVTGEINKLD